MAGILAVCGGAFGGLPLAAPYAYRPLGLPIPAPAVALARPAYAYGPAIAKVAAPVEDYDPNPQYTYAYDIQDALTGKSCCWAYTIQTS